MKSFFLWPILVVAVAALLFWSLVRGDRKIPKLWKQCAWCRSWYSQFGDKQSAQPDGINLHEVSHGICEECLTEQKRELGRIKRGIEAGLEERI